MSRSAMTFVRRIRTPKKSNQVAFVTHRGTLQLDAHQDGVPIAMDEKLAQQVLPAAFAFFFFFFFLLGSVRVCCYR